MLIIFDLDDTLIDTSGCITKVMLEEALATLCKSGLHIPDFALALRDLLHLDENAQTGEEGLSEFLELHDAMHLLPQAVEILYGPFPEDLPIHSLDAAEEVLSSLKCEHILALVTAGNPERQRLKMEKAGIESGLFSRIIATNKESKKGHYEQLLQDLGFAAQHVLVCGDRIAYDLRPAKELGCKTVHMRWGRGRVPTSHTTDVDFSINHLRELKEIVSTCLIL